MKSLEETIKDNCLLCDKKFLWKEVVIGKMPENVWFCNNCITKFEDNQRYDKYNSWIVLEYEPNTVLEFNK